MDPGEVARQYDYVASMDEPADAPSALLQASVCWQGQRRLRRAL